MSPLARKCRPVFPASRIKLHVANFLKLDFLDLVAVLLVLILACLLWLVGADQSFLLLAHRLDGLLLALVADLPGLILAVLGVAVLLCLLWASLHFELADFLWLEMAVLLLYREGEDIREFLAIPVDISLANLDLDLAWDIVAALCRLPCTDDSLGSIAIVLGALIPLAVELNGVCASYVVDDLFLHVAVRGLDISTLVVILGSHVDLVSGVAHSVLPSEAPLDLVRFLQCLVVDSLHQITDKLVHIKTDSFYLSLNDSSAIVEQPWNTRLFVLGVASPLSVRFALVLEYHLLNHMAVGVLVDTVASHISLPYVRMISLSRSRCWIHRRLRGSSQYSRQTGQVDKVHHVDVLSSL